MKVVKVILGLACLVLALILAPFAWVSFRWGELWFKLIPLGFMLVLAAVGLVLIVKRRQAFSRPAKFLMLALLIVLTLSPVLLVASIRHHRRVLQARAKAFLSIPAPRALRPNSEGYIGDEYVGTNEAAEVQSLGQSRELIERYATKGRIRWSARIQAEFAITPEQLWFPGADDIERTNQEAHAYLAERNAILSDEWRMGFWQWVEDTIGVRISNFGFRNCPVRSPEWGGIEEQDSGTRRRGLPSRSDNERRLIMILILAICCRNSATDLFSRRICKAAIDRRDANTTFEDSCAGANRDR